MRLAIFSDIHSNLEALETAVQDAQSRKIDFYAVLGDSVGYGANPNECFEWVAKVAGISIAGNHEKAVIDTVLRESFNPLAHEAIVWTETKMDKNFKKKIEELPYLKIDQGLTFAHGSPDRPEDYRYLISFEDAEPSFRHFDQDICFVGHTHVPACFCQNARTAARLAPGILSLARGERYILNPGSIGQPRDRDPRLAYGIFDADRRTFEIVRLPYDNIKAANKIRKVGLPRYLADRLL
jgi:predicted phosphodiesterase